MSSQVVRLDQLQAEGRDVVSKCCEELHLFGFQISNDLCAGVALSPEVGRRVAIILNCTLAEWFLRRAEEKGEAK